MPHTLVSPTAATAASRLREVLHVLHLEDNEGDHALIMAHLRHSARHIECIRVDTEAQFLSALQAPHPHWDLIVSDYNLPGFSGLSALKIIKSNPDWSDCPFIIVSGEIGEDLAVQALRFGASDYILKGNLTRLSAAAESALEASAQRSARLQADTALRDSRRQVAELAQHLQTSVDDERVAIAREIHDDVGGALTALKFDLSWLQRHCTEPQHLQRLASAQETLNQALQASKRIMHNLHPAILEQGLVPALHWMVSNFAQRTSVQARFLSNKEHLQLPPQIPLVVYRTAQECLTNVTKHAQASAVNLDLMVSDDMLSLEVSDNGKGLNTTDLDKASSFGLRGLRERAHRVGGWVDVSSQGRGTSILLSIPIESAQHPVA